MFPPDSVGCPPEQYSSSVAGDSASTENHVRKTQVDGELGKPMQEDRGNDVCHLTGFREAYVETNSISRNKVPAPSELPRKNGDDFDLLSSFIMLRSKQMVTQTEESKDVEIQEEGNFWHMEALCGMALDICVNMQTNDMHMEISVLYCGLRIRKERDFQLKQESGGKEKYVCYIIHTIRNGMYNVLFCFVLAFSL